VGCRWGSTRPARPPPRDDLRERVERALERAQVAPSALVLEVTESALMGDTSAGQEAFRKLRARGVRVHMDDFGTGYSSLSYLHKFPLDALKIDGSFTSRLHDNPGAEEIVRTVLSIASDLSLDVIAEGVENKEQLERLRMLGCHEAQGFLFGAPLPLEALEALLRRGPKLAVA
jgi:EAL domain-containing protein (putative c-di-GMP-specific phosphodiesterase class I)